MLLNSLRLEDFRCFSEYFTEFSPSVNVISGKNGMGKTSLLEAIFFLATVRSMRTTKERELIRKGAHAGRIEASFLAGSLPGTVCVELGEKRRITLSGAVLSSPRQLLGKLASVLFSPDDLELLRGGAAQRRRFLDMALCQLRPRYVSALSVYRKLLAEKTQLLQKCVQKPSFLQALPEYNIRLAETGALLARYREDYVKRLAECAARHHLAISGGRENLGIAYQSHAQSAEKTLALLEEKQQSELARGRCLVGAHCDDILAHLDGAPVRAFGSQGQVRTAALALKLGERDILSEELGEAPLLLLDDVLSELDEHRQAYILHRLDGGQVLITCCHPSGLTSLPSGKNILVGED